ncbi:BPL-N domain-containing protein [Streptomyces sp. 1331.2]|uniref:BPL-N domain-containing protein n=2 Tax=Streptomyces sp. 1331.2 TaxID=1938835 RepID=UPI0015CF40AB|nr:BPL-N domain-containing protein [Streptomyces sp. 1331.2]
MRAALAVVLAVVAAGCGGSPGGDGQAQPADGRPLALVYRGPAACEGCPEAARTMLEHGGFAVRYVGPRERLRFGPSALAGVALYVQPGGSNGQEVSTAWELLGRESGFSPELVRAYVRGGGRYLGLCMGGYLAGDPGFDLLPGDSGQYARSPGASVSDERDRLVDVLWRGRPQRMYFQDGPYFDVDGPGTQVLARYPGGRPAVVVAPYGAGRVAVSGPHPEAPGDWYRDYGLPDESEAGLALGEDLLRTLTGDTAPGAAPAPSP